MKFVRFFDPKKNYDFASKFKMALVAALVVPLISLFGMSILGINEGIDFSGGTEMQIVFPSEVSSSKLKNFLDDLGFEKNQVQTYGEEKNFEMLIRVDKGGDDESVSFNEKMLSASAEIESALKKAFGEIEVRQVGFVDSHVSKQLRTNGALAVIFALLAILIYIAIRFDILFSPGAIIALVHDTMGAMLVFIFGRLEFDLPSIAALLTIVGYSINNTIVIYDRIREIIPKNPKNPLSEGQVVGFVNQAVNETMSRTINTSLTTLFASVSLFLLAGGVVQSFALVLSCGIVLGAFSSTFIAPACYVALWKWKGNKSDDRKEGYSREDRARGVV